MKFFWWSVKDVCRVRGEKLQMWIAWHLPKWLVKWAAIRLIAHASASDQHTGPVPELTAMDAVKAWETQRSKNEPAYGS